MLHAHTHSPDVIEAARQEAENTGEELPDYVTNAPVLRFGVALFYNAWFELDLERDRARLHHITRSSCFQYARDYELSESQTDDLWYYIARMDSEFLKWYAPQIRPADNGNANRPIS